MLYTARLCTVNQYSAAHLSRLPSGMKQLHQANSKLFMYVSSGRSEPTAEYTDRNNIPDNKDLYIVESYSWIILNISKKLSTLINSKYTP